MPPKHKLVRKQNKTQSKSRTQHIHPSKLNKTIIHSTIPNPVRNDDDSSLYSPSLPATTDAFTISVTDRQYMQISKQILQYELKRKQINVESMMKQALLEGDEIRLPTSTSSDWRLALQDSVTTDDLRQGCLSLFERVNSKVKLIPIEVYHAVHFLEYATIRTKHREFPQKALLEVIFPEEFKCPTKLTSSLINLVCHPSDTLRTAALSFFAIGLSTSSQKFSLAVIATRLLPQLFQSLKPDEIPINGTTIDFHRHITSIVGTFLNCSPLEILGHLNAKSIS